MQKVLIDVDTQFDFCDPRGALFVAGADALADRFRGLIARAVRDDIPIVASVDSHAFDAWEFAGASQAGPHGEQPNFPAHCVKGTVGWLKVPGTLPERARFIPNVRVEPSELSALLEGPRALLLEKEVYSLFANPNAETVLEHVVGVRPASAPQFVVFGVATDYCVRAAVLGLLEWLERTKRDGEVLLVKDAIAAVDPHGGERAIAECVHRGARLVTSSEAL